MKNQLFGWRFSRSRQIVVLVGLIGINIDILNNYLRVIEGFLNAVQVCVEVSQVSFGKVQLNKYMSENIIYNTPKSLSRCITLSKQKYI